MRIALKILLFALLVSSCKASDHPVEDKLYTCLVQQYDAQGIDIVTVLDSLENHYIQEGILASASGKAKLKYYERIANSGEVPSMLEYALADRIAQLNISQNDIESCLMDNGVDSLALTKSKYHQLKQANEKVVEVNPKNVAICHTDILNENDFKHPYYRAHMLITYTRIYGRPNAYTRN